jgi:hypothetical protein
MDEAEFLIMFTLRTVRDLKTLLEVLIKMIHDLLASESEFDMLLHRGISYENLLDFAIFLVNCIVAYCHGTVLNLKHSLVLT